MPACVRGGVSTRGRYTGGGIGLVDDKGRVAIPASLRATLIANAGQSDGKTIVVGVHQKSRCAVAFEPGYLDRLAEDLDRREREHTAEDGEFDYSIKRKGSLAAEATSFDASGRFTLSGFPRFHADIGAHAFFWGSMDVIEIWNPKLVLSAPDIPEVMLSACRYHLAEKGIVL